MDVVAGLIARRISDTGHGEIEAVDSNQDSRHRNVQHIGRN